MAKQLKRADVPTVGDVRILNGLIHSIPANGNEIKRWHAQVYLPLQYDTVRPTSVLITVGASDFAKSFQECLQIIHTKYLYYLQ